MQPTAVLGLAAIASLSFISIALADEPKNHDFDVVREESMVPPYHLPPLLVSSEGKRISTPEEWFHIRRPQIMALFGSMIYGVVPEPEPAITTSFDVVKTDQRDLVQHNEVEFSRGIHPLFYRQGQSFPHANEWGCISAIAWGASRALDYLETDSDLDAKRIAIMGHSKMGKAALWTAAQDQRFALAISAQSGCAGAALWRRNFGENMEKMVTRFPYWLCRNAAKFSRHEDDLPVDQHMLLACCTGHRRHSSPLSFELLAKRIGASKCPDQF